MDYSLSSRSVSGWSEFLWSPKSFIGGEKFVIDPTPNLTDGFSNSSSAIVAILRPTLAVSVVIWTFGRREVRVRPKGTFWGSPNLPWTTFVPLVDSPIAEHSHNHSD